MIPCLRILIPLVSFLCACSATRPPASLGSCTGKCDELVEAGYVFAGGEYERVDTTGVPLTSTSLTNRSDEYQLEAPYGAHYLLTFRRYLAAMHGGWREQLRSLGFAPCSWSLVGIDAVVPCTLQRLWPGGPKALDVIRPDLITLDVDEPIGFPNGRILDEQVNDLVLAMGFLDLGGTCAGDPSGVCTLRTFVDIQLNPPANDRPFQAEFPYLPLAHGHHAYWAERP
jgi:hypothetical protein